MRRKILRQTEYLIEKGTVSPETRDNPVFLPSPYLQRASALKYQKLFVARLVAHILRRTPSRYVSEQLHLPEGACRQRIYEFKKAFGKRRLDARDIVELEWASFRSYDLGPYGKKITKNLPPLSCPHWFPRKALSSWERRQIAELCAAAI